MTIYKGLMKFQRLVKSGGSVINPRTESAKGMSGYRNPESEMAVRAELLSRSPFI